MTTRLLHGALNAFEYLAGCALLLATATRGVDIATRPRRFAPVTTDRRLRSASPVRNR